MCWRLLALEGGFFAGRDKLWNVFDLNLLSVSVLDSTVLQASGVRPAHHDAQGFASGTCRAYATRITVHALSIQIPVSDPGVHQLLLGTLLGSGGAVHAHLPLLCGVRQQLVLICRRRVLGQRVHRGDSAFLRRSSNGHVDPVHVDHRRCKLDRVCRHLHGGLGCHACLVLALLRVLRCGSDERHHERHRQRCKLRWLTKTETSGAQLSC